MLRWPGQINRVKSSWISDSVTSGSLLPDAIICSMISLVRLFRDPTGRPFGLPDFPGSQFGIG